MKRKLTAKILFLILLFSQTVCVFADDDKTPKPYEEDEFPQSLKDLRRFEIITLGSLPFVTLDATIAYSSYRYAKHDFDSKYKPDIFSTNSFTQDEQKGIILSSLGISVGIGLTDFIVQAVKRSSKKRKAPVNYDDIAVIPIAEDEDASVIPLPEEHSDENEIQEIEE